MVFQTKQKNSCSFGYEVIFNVVASITGYTIANQALENDPELTRVTLWNSPSCQFSFELANKGTPYALFSVLIERTSVHIPKTSFVVERQNSFVIWKRCSEFYQLYEHLTEVYADIPSLPRKTLTRDLSSRYLDFRRSELEYFVKELCKRNDIMMDERTIEFFQCEEVLKEFREMMTPFCDENTDSLHPKVILEVKEKAINISRAGWYWDKQILVLGCTDNSLLSRLDAFLMNVNFPWVSQNQYDRMPVGRVSFWKKHEEEEDEDENQLKGVTWKKPKFELIFFYDVNSHVESIYCCNVTQRVFIGLSNGTIEQFVIHTTPEKKFIKYALNSHNEYMRCRAQKELLQQSVSDVSQKEVHQVDRLLHQKKKSTETSSQIMTALHILVDGTAEQNIAATNRIGSAIEQQKEAEINNNRRMVFDSKEKEKMTMNTQVHPSCHYLTLVDTNITEENELKTKFNVSSFVIRTTNVVRQSAHSLGYILPRHTGPVTCFGFDLDYAVLYSGSFDGSIKAYHLRDQRVLAETMCPSAVSSLCLIQVPRLLIVGGATGALYVYMLSMNDDGNLKLHIDVPPKMFIPVNSSDRLKTNVAFQAVESHKGKITCIIGNKVATSAGHYGLREENSSSSFKTSSLLCKDSEVVLASTSISFLTGSMDGTVCIWDYTLQGRCSNMLRIRCKVCISPLMHKVTCMADCSAPSPFVAIGTSAGTVHVLNANTCQLMYGFVAHSKCIRSIQWSTRGSVLLTAGHDKLLKWWRFKAFFRHQRQEQEEEEEEEERSEIEDEVCRSHRLYANRAENSSTVTPSASCSETNDEEKKLKHAVSSALIIQKASTQSIDSLPYREPLLGIVVNTSHNDDLK